MKQLSIFDVSDILIDPLFFELETLKQGKTVEIRVNNDLKMIIFKNVFGVYQIESEEIEEVFNSINEVYEFIKKMEVVEIE